MSEFSPDWFVAGSFFGSIVGLFISMLMEWIEEQRP
jgi:hypothetical protein